MQKQIQKYFFSILLLTAISITGCTQKNVAENNTKPTTESQLQTEDTNICEVNYNKYEEALEGDGLLFEIDESEETAKVVSYSDLDMTDVVIPDSIKYEDNEYPVTAIGESALESHMTMETLTLGTNISAIESSAFYTCFELREINMSDSLLSIGVDTFGECTALKTIKWSDSLTTLGDNCFRACESLEEIELPGSLTECGIGAFTDCIGLKKCIFGDGIQAVGEGMFTNCENLTDVILPDTLIFIQPEAFWGCYELTEIELPDTLSNISGRAFYSTGIKKLHMPEAVTGIKVDMLEGMDDIETIEVPKSKESSYKDVFKNYSIKIDVY